MNDVHQNRLAFLPAEKRKLRRHKIKVSEVHLHSLDELQEILGVSKLRAMELTALSEFQSLPSVGIEFALNLISLGFYSLRDLAGKDPAKLTDRFERQMGVWIDPCLEDQFRLVVHYAQHPGSVRNWWDFTNERKAFRQKKGYPSSRPTKPWHELPQFQRWDRISAVAEVTKKDLYKRLKLAVQFMNRHLDEDVTLNKLANVSHISSFHFLRLFKSAYEVTPIQFLTRLRLKKACRLLRKTNRLISVIGPQCGFANESSFSRLFKKQFKMSPLAFRRSGKG